MADTAGSNSVLGLTAQIVSAHVSNNAVASDALPSLIQEVYKTLSGIGTEVVEAERPQPAVPIKRSVFADHIVCLEDGKKLKMLKRHLKTLGPAGRVSDGCAELRRTPLRPRQGNRPGHQGPRRVLMVQAAGSPLSGPAGRLARPAGIVGQAPP